MLSTFSDASGPSGFEDEVIEAGRAFAADLAAIKEDSLRNLYLYRNENTGSRPIIMLDAHSDEVGFMIRTVNPNGTMKFMTLGGWTNYSIPAHKVRVRARDGSWISGVVASKPKHHMTAAERDKTPEVADMVIDVGELKSNHASSIVDLTGFKPKIIRK